MSVIIFPILSNAESDFFDFIPESFQVEPNDSSNRSFEIGGEFDLRAHYAGERQIEGVGFERKEEGLSSLRLDIYLEANYDINRSLDGMVSALLSHDDEAVDEKTLLEIDETYLDWMVSPRNLIRIGRQLYTVGESSFFQILDGFNPVDERVLGLFELDEMKLPVAATRWNYFRKRWNLNMIFIQEFRSNRSDPPTGDFDPKINLRAQGFEAEVTEPNVDLNRPKGIVKLGYASSVGDLSIIWSKNYRHQSLPYMWNGEKIEYVYPEVENYGITANWVFGSWLLKSEYSKQIGNLHPLNIESLILTPSVFKTISVEADVDALMVGGRFNGVDNLTLEIELMGKKISAENTADIYERRESVQLAVQMTYEMLNDKLALQWFNTTWLKDVASINRFRIDYTLLDELQVYGGFIIYTSNTHRSMLDIYEKNDRIFAGLTFSF